MKKKSTSRSNLFFLELIIVIFIIALTSTLLVSVFMKANTLREASKNQTYAMIAMQSVAESIKGEGAINPAHFPIYYDAEWTKVDTEAEALFAMDMRYEEEETVSGTLLSVSLSIGQLDKIKEEAIWQMAFKEYIPRYEER